MIPRNLKSMLMGQFYNDSKCSRSEKGQLYVVQRFHPYTPTHTHTRPIHTVNILPNSTRSAHNTVTINFLIDTFVNLSAILKIY